MKLDDRAWGRFPQPSEIFRADARQRWRQMPRAPSGKRRAAAPIIDRMQMRGGLPSIGAMDAVLRQRPTRTVMGKPFRQPLAGDGQGICWTRPDRAIRLKLQHMMEYGKVPA